MRPGYKRDHLTVYWNGVVTNDWAVMLHNTDRTREEIFRGDKRQAVRFAKEFSRGDLPIYLFSRSGLSGERII